MSALGQKQTCAAQKGMSALPPIAEFTASLGYPCNSHEESLLLCEPPHIRGRSTANTLSTIRIAMRPIKGSVKCHANSIPAALSKLSCSPGWRCFSYLPPSYPPDPRALGSGHVRFGSKADMCSAKGHVRFTPESGHVRCN